MVRPFLSLCTKCLTQKGLEGAPKHILGQQILWQGPWQLDAPDFTH